MPDNQQNLFDTEPPPWELDDAGQVLVASVVLPVGPEGPFDYIVPEKLRAGLKAGRRVRVPFGRSNRLVIGYCVNVATREVVGRKLKEVRETVDSSTLLSPAMLRLTEWMSQRYLCPWGQVLEAVVPTAVRARAGTKQVIFLDVDSERIEKYTNDQNKLSDKQKQVIRYLLDAPHPLPQSHVATAVGCTEGPIRALRKKGLLQTTTRRVQANEPEEAVVAKEPDLQLNSDQRLALDSILEVLRGQRHETFLMHGVTGSGKTEVYIQAIREVVSYGRQAIVLVPEISLTPQTQHRFRCRFESVAVLHSHMSPVERHWHWGRIARGEIQVVVGARSAIFAPTPHLGLVVLDEEHDSSFKQETAPRYHARDVAVQRATAEQVPLVLGSATPSQESWYRATEKEYRLLELPRRALNRKLPDVQTIDLTLDYRDRYSRGALSRRMRQAIQASLGKGGQVILLLNRRGFSTHIQCRACGEVVRCPHCDIALTHHRQGEKAKCHYCDFLDDAPIHCPSCSSPGIRYSGLGTQRLEAEVRASFPAASCLRMDSDSMSKHGSHEEALNLFREGKIQILLGTQMIAKGLDFPNVTLVGVVNADTALHLPDFRAAERTFQLVTQVAGRTGRGDKGGLVLVQTFSHDHPAIQAATKHDYHSFASRELESRREFGYPPCTAMIRLVVRGPENNLTEEFAERMAADIRQEAVQQQVETRLLGPTEAPLAKIRGKYRYHMILQGDTGDALRKIVSAATRGLRTPDEIQWIVDVDPDSML